MQRRWLAGGLALAAFTTTTTWFLVRAAKVLIDYYQLAYDFAGAPESHAQPRDIAVPFLVALVVYAVCLVDTAVADVRLRRRVSGASERRSS